IDFQGVPLTYYIDEIERIDGVKQGLPLPIAKDQESTQENSSVIEYLRSGIAYYKQGNFPQAIADYTKSIEMKPTFEAYTLRGNAYGEQGNFPQAIADFTKAIEMNPNIAGAYLGRGAAYLAQRNFTQADLDLTKAIEINPNVKESYYARAFVYYGTKEYDKAWADVHKAEGMGLVVDPQFLAELKKASENKKTGGFLGGVVEKLKDEKMKASAASAQANLKVFSTAAEIFATAYGVYPESAYKLDSFLKNKAGDLLARYCGKTELGFTYVCDLSSTGYTFTATPVEEGWDTIYKVTTGQVFSTATK
ncbi:MAG: tetratricopeptide repeat protein, partial [Candidatus Omnitrophica bacterium]|nr:tetratricopeptide repeat protein [Candidatus Omnitrophota bacterium]